MKTSNLNVIERLEMLASEVNREFLSAAEDRNFDAANRLHVRVMTILDCIDVVRSADQEEEAA